VNSGFGRATSDSVEQDVELNERARGRAGRQIPQSVGRIRRAADTRGGSAWVNADERQSG